MGRDGGPTRDAYGARTASRPDDQEPVKPAGELPAPKPVGPAATPKDLTLSPALGRDGSTLRSWHGDPSARTLPLTGPAMQKNGRP